jgi:hypothetical protein
MAFRSSRADTVLAILLAAALVVAMVLWLYHPVVPRSVLRWILLFAIGIPIWFLLEWLGGRILGAQFFSRLGRAARIALAVPVLLLLLIIAAYIIHLGQRAVAGS